MDHRKLSGEVFQGEGELSPEDGWWYQDKKEISSSNQDIKKEAPKYQGSTTVTSNACLYNDENDVEGSEYQKDFTGSDYINTDPTIVMYCVDLISKFQPCFSPDEYLTFELSKKKRLKEPDLIIVTELFFGVIDEELLLSSFIHRLKSSSVFRKVNKWNKIGDASLKVLAWIFFRWSRRLHPCSQFAIYCGFGMDLVSCFYDFVVKFANSNLLPMMCEVYTPDYVERYLTPNILAGCTIIKEVLTSLHGWEYPRSATPRRTTKVKPFKFDSRRSSAQKKSLIPLSADEDTQFKAHKVPIGTYKLPEVNKLLEKEFEKNRRNSLNLLEAARRSTLDGRRSKDFEGQYSSEIVGEVEGAATSDEEAFTVDDEVEEAEADEGKHIEIDNMLPSEGISRRKPSKGKRPSRKSIGLKGTITKENSFNAKIERKRNSMKGESKSFHASSTTSNQERPQTRHNNEDKEEKVDSEEIVAAIEHETRSQDTHTEQGQEDTEANDEYEGESQRNVEGHPSEGVVEKVKEQKVQKEGATKGRKLEPTKAIRRMELSQVLEEPSFRGGHTFASAMRIRKLFQNRDEQELQEFDNLLIVPPTPNPLKVEQIAEAEAETRLRKWNQIRSAVSRAKDASHSIAIANQRKADHVRKEAEALRQQKVANIEMEQELAKRKAKWVKQINEHAAFMVQFMKQKKKDDVQDMKKRTNDLLASAKQKAKIEENARLERIQRIKADTMFSYKPVVIKNPFEVRKNEMSDAEAQLRLQVIRRRNEAQLGLLRAKIKNEKEERAAKFKSALQEIETRRSRKYYK